MLQNIRAALPHRDACYQVGDGVLELDAGTFGRRASGNQGDVLVAIETKASVDGKGRARRRAGFAKVLVAKEIKPYAQQLLDTGIRAGALENTDGSPSLRQEAGVELDDQVGSGDTDARAMAPVGAYVYFQFKGVCEWDGSRGTGQTSEPVLGRVYISVGPSS